MNPTPSSDNNLGSVDASSEPEQDESLGLAAQEPGQDAEMVRESLLARSYLTQATFR